MRNILIFTLIILLSINLSSATAYTIAGHVKYMDTDSSYKPVPYAYIDVYNSTWGYHAVADVNGYYAFVVNGQGSYNVMVSKEGYITQSFYKTFNTDLSDYVVYIDKETAPNYITPHYVKYTVKDIYGNSYKNIQTKLYSNGTLTSTLMTGTDGGVGYLLSENTEYRLTFINATQGINREWEGYPTESSYDIIVFPDPIVPEDREVDDILFGLTSERINVSTGWINVTFNDTSGTTNFANLKMYIGQLNETLFYSTATTDTQKTWTAQVPANNTNYTVIFTINNDQLGEDLVITRVVVFADNNRYDLGFDDGWNYILIAVLIVVGLFALFSRVNAEVGAMVGILTAWFFWMLGWLNNGLDSDAQLTMGLMLLFGTLLAAGAYIRKGEDP